MSLLMHAKRKLTLHCLIHTVNTTGNDLYRAAGFVMQTTMVPSNHLHVMECGFESPICQTTREIPQNQSGGVIRQLFGLKCKSVRLAFLEFPSSLQWSFLWAQILRHKSVSFEKMSNRIALHCSAQGISALLIYSQHNGILCELVAHKKEQT